MRGRIPSRSRRDFDCSAITGIYQADHERARAWLQKMVAEGRFVDLSWRRRRSSRGCVISTLICAYDAGTIRSTCVLLHSGAQSSPFG